MINFLKWAIALCVIAPIVFVLEAFVYGGPMTVAENTRSVREACIRGGGSGSHCSCVADEFESRLNVNEIIMRRLMFVRETIPDKQFLYEEADRACRIKLQ